MTSLSPEMILSDLFKSRTRALMLQDVLEYPEVTVSRVSSRTGIPKGTVSRYLSVLVREGYLKRVGRGFNLQDSPLVTATRLLLNIIRLRTLVTLPVWAESIGAYGSWGTGTNTGESDLDLWVYCNNLPAAADIARFQRSLRERLKTDVNLFVLTPERIRKIRDEDLPFYASFSSSMITIRGKPVVLP